MFRRNVSQMWWSGADVLSAPPDTAGTGAAPTGGDGSQPSDAGNSGDAGDFGDAGDDAGGDPGDAGDADAGERDENLEDLLVDEDDDDQPGQAPRTAEDRIKALAKKNTKLRKQMAKRLTALKRIEGMDLDELLYKARSYDNFDAATRRNPRLRALLDGGDADDDTADGPTARPRKGKMNEPPAFDESALPFDPNENPTNRYFADMAKRNHALEHQLGQLVARLDGVEQLDGKRSEAAVTKEWTSVIRGASEQVKDPAVRDLFKDALLGAMHNPQIRGKYTPQQIVAHYLKRLNIAPAQAQRAVAAARQRVATNNKNLPRHPPNGGMPAAARPAKNERMEDVRKRLSQSTR